MNELLAGYANYASTESILHECERAEGQSEPDSSVTVTVTVSVSPTTITFTF